jgi:hypothetical protein
VGEAEEGGEVADIFANRAKHCLQQDQSVDSLQRVSSSIEGGTCPSSETPD